jgi:RES domain-containing protein
MWSGLRLRVEVPLIASIARLSSTTQWLHSRKSLLAEVPSIVVPDEFNVLINPRHPDSGNLTPEEIRRWNYDARLM